MDEQFDPTGYYDDAGEREWNRLDGDLYHRLEWEETWHVLDAHLPPEGRVLDVGGGAGRYAVELAERGYDVTLVDPSETQVELAAEKAGDRDVADRVTAQVGDVRDLPVGTDAVAATLCLGGPLSHVLDADERATAAEELARVTAPDGPVVVSVMGRLAALQTIARVAGREEVDVDETVLLPELARTGDYDRELLAEHHLPPTAPPMHLFRADELERLLAEAGLAVEAVTGLESVVSQRRAHFDALDDDQRAALRATVAALRGDRGVADLSGHLLAVGYA